MKKSNLIHNMVIVGGLLLSALATQAHASTVVATNCVSVTDSAGCLFSGNINGNPNPGNANSFLSAQNAYNLFNDSHPTANPDIALSFLGDTIAGFPGTFTGAGTSSGTWSLPGFFVDFVAVKASNEFVLYQITPASSGNWNTFNIPFNQNPHNLSHLAFFGAAAPAVPEPTTWALMLAGMGLVGSMLRRRKTPLAAA